MGPPRGPQGPSTTIFRPLKKYQGHLKKFENFNFSAPSLPSRGSTLPPILPSRSAWPPSLGAWPLAQHNIAFALFAPPLNTPLLQTRRGRSSFLEMIHIKKIILLYLSKNFHNNTVFLKKQCGGRRSSAIHAGKARNQVLIIVYVNDQVPILSFVVCNLLKV